MDAGHSQNLMIAKDKSINLIQFSQTGTSLNFPASPPDKNSLEESAVFSPRFDRDGLVTAVVTDTHDGVLLMVAHMNAQALALTIETGIAHYWSRSRGKLWKKGETSGNLQRVVELRTDCDQDALWLKVSVNGHGATCHTGRRSCFYRTIMHDKGTARLVNDGSKQRFDPDTVYIDKTNR